MRTVVFKFRPRSYLHFDSPIGKEAAEALATSSERVSGHSFYPFISRRITSTKIKKGAEGKIERKPPKVREIAYAAHKDSQIYAHYGDILMSQHESKLRERGLTESVTAFRSIERKSNIHFANEVFEFIRQSGPCSVLAMDVRDFFGSLDHDSLKSSWCRLLGVERLSEDHFKVFKSLSRYTSVALDEVQEALGLPDDGAAGVRGYRLCSPSEFREKIRGLCVTNISGKGIPQGSPMSAVLSNIYLLEFDQAVNDFVKAHGGLYRRYCDDILVVLPTDESLKECRQLIEDRLADLKLPVSAEKTEEFTFVSQGDRLWVRKPLQYLGFTFDGRFKRLRPASIARYYKKMRAGVRRAKAIRARADVRRGVGFTTWLKRKKVYNLYSYVGRHNFISYAFRASRIMNEPGIKKQVKRHWLRLQEEIDEP